MEILWNDVGSKFQLTGPVQQSLGVCRLMLWLAEPADCHEQPSGGMHSQELLAVLCINGGVCSKIWLHRFVAKCNKRRQI